MALAAELRLPLVLVIDTAGPALSAKAEQGGLAGQIAQCLAELVTLDTPTVSVLLGQGSGGPALAMVPVALRLAALHGRRAPLPPEGASAIVFRDTAHAAELAAAQGIRVGRPVEVGDVDAIVPEHPDAADEPVAFCRATVAGHRRRGERAARNTRRRTPGRPVAAVPPHWIAARLVTWANVSVGHTLRNGTLTPYQLRTRFRTHLRVAGQAELSPFFDVEIAAGVAVAEPQPARQSR